MLRFIVNRIILIPIILLLINFGSFSYAQLAVRAQQASNPWGSSAVDGTPPLFDLYRQYFQGVIHFDLGSYPGSSQAIVEILSESALASLGLIGIAFTLSTAIGLIAGFFAVRIQPTRIAGWVTPIATVGLALPSFFIAALFIATTIAYLLNQPNNIKPPLPLSGYGWDAHLLIPVIALMVRPIAQVAQTTASTLVEELDKQYITAARSVGNTWKSARQRHALRNVLAPVIITIASSLRWMFAELLLVEWIFAWPGLGRLLANVLIPPQTASLGSMGSASNVFLYPPLLAALVTLFAFFFLLSDLFASVFAQTVDPRVRARPQGELPG